MKSVLLIINMERAIKRSHVSKFLAMGEVRLPKGRLGSTGNLSVELVRA